MLPYLTGIFVEGTEGSLVPEDVITQETDSLKVATHSPASFPLKGELAGFSTFATSLTQARGQPRKTKPGSVQSRHLESPIKGQGSEQPQAQLQPEAQPHPQLQAHECSFL